MPIRNIVKVSRNHLCSDITWYRTRVRGSTVLVDVLLILHVSRTTKITVTLFAIISTFIPLAAEKSGGTTDRVIADSPYNWACFSRPRL